MSYLSTASPSWLVRVSWTCCTFGRLTGHWSSLSPGTRVFTIAPTLITVLVVVLTIKPKTDASHTPSRVPWMGGNYRPNTTSRLKL